ncbi:hypothetical protein OG225_12875 [Nocardia sp. NBC_01377]|uniref:hypothetical protein n=1 Tax=Nocardia TaxID=1817 RepID=UPI001C24B672|nr:hypothetical protein [Nocardia noduli]
MNIDEAMRADGISSETTFPGTVFAIRCLCGLEIAAANSRILVHDVNRHLDTEHPRVAGHYDDDDILALAYLRPAIATKDDDKERRVEHSRR